MKLKTIGFFVGVLALSPILIGGLAVLLVVFPYETAGEKNPGIRKRMRKWVSSNVHTRARKRQRK